MGFAMSVLQFLAFAFVGVVGTLLFITIVLFVVDRFQTGDAIRRNYPVLGRFRHLFSTLGEFFRQYFFAMDREELPFNRAQREWVKRASEGHGNTVAFESTRNLNVVGTPIFANAPFPPLNDQFACTEPMVIGADTRMPFMAKSFFNISGMSYGAISKPAVQALRRGANEAGIWMNTGEGGLARFIWKAAVMLCFRLAPQSLACVIRTASYVIKSCARFRRTKTSVCLS